MILRKPYAFIIKRFKLLHLILTILLGISVYRVGIIVKFLNEYIDSPSLMLSTLSAELTGSSSTFQSLFPFYVFILPLIVVLVSVVILFILYNKKKPFLLYIITILYSVILLGFYAVIYNLVGQMQTTIPDIRFLNVVKDLFNIMRFLGIGVCVLTLVRATGFDIKKFNFVKDLQELDISEEDNEEFEVELNVDSNIIRRNIRKKLRHLKYMYFEHKFMVNLVVLLFLIITSFIIYFVVLVHHKNYNQNAYFGSDEFSMHIDNVYLTNKDYLGNQITDNYLVVIDLNVNSSYVKGKKLDIANCILVIDGREFKHTPVYRDLLYDIGTVYEDNLIYRNKENYLLVYEIPKKLIDKKMTFRYTMSLDLFASNVREKYAKVKLNPINLDDNITSKSYDLTEKITLNDSVMKNLSILIDSYDINSVMAEYYRFCISTKECFDSVEYIRPTIGNVDKTILKVNGKIENSSINRITNLYNLIEKFGKIEYSINDNKKLVSVIGKLTPRHTSSDTYYIEIPKEIEKSDTVSLKLYIRNKIYEYRLKEKIEDN